MMIKMSRKALCGQIVLWAACLLFCLPHAAYQAHFGRVDIIPDLNGFITVKASLKLQNSTIYVKDFGRAENIRLTIGGKNIPFITERRGNTLYFRQLPTYGEAVVSFDIKSFIQKSDRKNSNKIHGGVFISSAALLAGADIIPCIDGLEEGLVDIRWRLPQGWKLISGKAGIQRLSAAKDRIWVAGRLSQRIQEKIGNVIFTASVIKGATLLEGMSWSQGIKAFFRYAWENIGPLENNEFEVVVFPRGSIRGYIFLPHAIATEDAEFTLPHEILHWWSNPLMPFWFKEGVHSYMTEKIKIQVGLGNKGHLMIFLFSMLEMHRQFVKLQGRIVPLSESSDKLLDDYYYLGVLVAYRLDKEIQAFNPKMNLDRVFSVACRNRTQIFNIRDLIKKETGYDPELFFKKYLYGIVEHPEDLLK